MPNVVLEAMAYGVPVVATRIAGVPRVVKHEHNGMLVESGDMDALTSCLKKLLSDPELRMELSKNAQRTIEEDFDFSRRMALVASVYDGMDLSSNAGREKE